MEALWDLEDKLKISTLGAVLLLGCATFALVCLCIVITLRRKAFNNKIVHQEGALDEENEKDTTTTTNTNANTIIAATASPTEWSEPSCVGWISVKRVLMGSMLWSKASKLEENMAWQRERGSPLLGLQRQGLESGWQSNNSESPVWQRPILRGGKCELPSFSGLILYDEKGRLLRDSENETHHFMETSQQEVGTVTVRTTLRDLL
ncbi:hypothetical protein PHAVU_011G168000 [Phaseolus vulgaris]|uniref:Uncharacterized protein n=1 Tax=Phaseolus vulgaris TaxID=3885 RepID=V7AIC8_PHAVU|nr:hypothetical protein PHAVU_011G168000g [Phaseolus vulgaris]ESW05294.1 hypothetical protein PHAVU_011G168000g [Phaseolus vulgaris]